MNNAAATRSTSGKKTRFQLPHRKNIRPDACQAGSWLELAAFVTDVAGIERYWWPNCRSESSSATNVFHKPLNINLFHLHPVANLSLFRQFGHQTSYLKTRTIAPQHHSTQYEITKRLLLQDQVRADGART